MAHGDGESLASEDYEALLCENKRKFDGTVHRDRDGSKAVVPAAPVASCSNVRPHMSDFDYLRQSVEEVVAYCEGKRTRPRAHEAAEALPKRVCSADLGTRAAFGNFIPRTTMIGGRRKSFLYIISSFIRVQSSDQRNFDQARKSDVRNVKHACAEESGHVSCRDCGGPSGSESFQVKFTFDKLTGGMESAEIRGPVKQGQPMTLAINMEASRSVKYEFML